MAVQKNERTLNQKINGLTYWGNADDIITDDKEIAKLARKAQEGVIAQMMIDMINGKDGYQASDFTNTKSSEAKTGQKFFNKRYLVNDEMVQKAARKVRRSYNPLKTKKQQNDYLKELEESSKEGFESRNRLIGSNILLIRKKVPLYSQRVQGLEQAEMEDIMAMGFMKTINLFDPKKGFKLTTYAERWMNQMVMRDGRLTATDFKQQIPIGQVNTRNRIRRAIVGLEKEQNTNPTNQQILDWIKANLKNDKGKPVQTSMNEVITGRWLVENESVTALDAPLSHEDGEGSSLGNMLVDEDTETPEDIVFKKELRERINQIDDEQQQQIIQYKFIQGQSDAAIAELMGVTPSKVKSLTRETRYALRKHLAPFKDNLK